jgi:hypothetical protein
MRLSQVLALADSAGLGDQAITEPYQLLLDDAIPAITDGARLNAGNAGGMSQSVDLAEFAYCVTVRQ